MVRRWSARFAAPLALTVILLAARLAGAPALSDPVAGSASPSLYLKVPLVYLVFAPVFTLWDGVSMLSMSRLKGLLIGLVVLYLVWRVIRLVTEHRRSDFRHSVCLWELRVLAGLVFLLF